MLTNTQEKLIKSLHTKKGRDKSGLCLVEGRKLIAELKDFLEFTFTPEDSKNFNKLITTATPQAIAGVARLPKWTDKDIINKNVIVILDTVQDPGNVGTILRLCLGFNASLVLIESADPGNPKVVRSSAGSLFHIPWLALKYSNILKLLNGIDRPAYRLENISEAEDFSSNNYKLPAKLILLAGSEGQGIKLNVKGKSIKIKHDPKLESLNIASALAIILERIY